MQKDLTAIFLAIMNKGLRKSAVKLQPDLEADDVAELLRMAEIHEILPLIYSNLWTEECFKKLDREEIKAWQERSLQIAVREIVQTNEFLTLMLHMQKQGLYPLVMKGYICRSLWPEPYLRPSVDEDIYVRRADALAAHEFFLSEGLFCDDEEPHPAEADETSYHKKDSPTYIEMHTSLFPQDSAAYGDCNRFFEKIDETYVEVRAEDVTLRTLPPTDHFLYLVLHAYKHFLHSGFGIRQIGDMVLFAERYGQCEGSSSNEYEKIDWDYIYNSCASQKIVPFTAALLKIGVKYFEFDRDKAGLSDIWRKEISRIDESDLLEDIMQAGLHGASDLNRIHSSSMTLEAVQEDKVNAHSEHSKGGKARSSGAARLLRTVFPRAKSLEKRYPYLKNRPYLLPAAWISRIFQYLAEDQKSAKISARKSIEIGKERTELLKEYGIIEGDH